MFRNKKKTKKKEENQLEIVCKKYDVDTRYKFQIDTI
jgi:hypothetical protein